MSAVAPMDLGAFGSDSDSPPREALCTSPVVIHTLRQRAICTDLADALQQQVFLVMSLNNGDCFFDTVVQLVRHEYPHITVEFLRRVVSQTFTLEEYKNNVCLVYLIEAWKSMFEDAGINRNSAETIYYNFMHDAMGYFPVTEGMKTRLQEWSDKSHSMHKHYEKLKVYVEENTQQSDAEDALETGLYILRETVLKSDFWGEEWSITKVLSYLCDRFETDVRLIVVTLRDKTPAEKKGDPEMDDVKAWDSNVRSAPNPPQTDDPLLMCCYYDGVHYQPFRVFFDIHKGVFRYSERPDCFKNLHI